MSWSYRILFVYLAFVGMIGYLIYRCTQENVELVADNYYEKELKFQDEIRMSNNSNALIAKPELVQVEGQLEAQLKFPESFDPAGISGTVIFFRPDNSALDFTTKINLDANRSQFIRNEKLSRGNWRTKLTWTYRDTSYYQEHKLFFN